MGQKASDYCSDFIKKRSACVLCALVMRDLPNARLIRCNWVPKKINVKLAQQNLF